MLASVIVLWDSVSLSLHLLRSTAEQHTLLFCYSFLDLAACGLVLLCTMLHDCIQITDSDYAYGLMLEVCNVNDVTVLLLFNNNNITTIRLVNNTGITLGTSP